MKKLLLGLLIFVSFFSYSQKKYIYLDSLFQNKDENLVISKIIEFEGKTKIDLKNKFKEVASKKFVNLKEITVSETDDNMTLVFIEEIPIYFKSLMGLMPINRQEYTRFLVYFKDNRIKIDLFDDGNVFVPSSYNGGIPTPSVEARIGYIKNALSDGKLEVPTEKDMYKSKNTMYQLVSGYISETKKMIPYFETEMNKQSVINNNW